MNTKTIQALRELRDILDLTQTEFAAAVGSSKDAVASWETGRNNLSRSFARRIALATGVEQKDLVPGRSPLTTRGPGGQRVPFTKETFQKHRASYWGSSDEAAARRHLRHCTDALELLFLAASRMSPAKGPSQLPAVVDSFVHWCEQTRKDFNLGKAIDEQLATRKGVDIIRQSYKEWRRKQQEEPALCRAMGFKDDPKKDDREHLELSLETVPVWRPGYSMRRPQEKG